MVTLEVNKVSFFFFAVASQVSFLMRVLAGATAVKS